MSMKSITIFVVFAGLTACATMVPDPTPAQLEVAQNRWPSATLPELVEGRRIYINQCSGCHNLPPPSELTATEWPAAIQEMGTEYAKISAAEIELITKYVVSARETPAPKTD
jgi:cytochrome c5